MIVTIRRLRPADGGCSAFTARTSALALAAAGLALSPAAIARDQTGQAETAQDQNALQNAAQNAVPPSAEPANAGLGEAGPGGDGPGSDRPEGNGQAYVEGNKTIYPASYFAAFSPVSALDMVRRVPGFVLEESDEDVRGFGQASGNVVINGQRPSAKSVSLSTFLERIPASTVQRIEVSSGTLFGQDYAGKSSVANIILNDEGGLSGTATFHVQRNFDGRLHPEGEVSALYRTGNNSYNAALKFENPAWGSDNYDELFLLPKRTFFSRRVEDAKLRRPRLSGSVSWANDEGDDRSFNLNARIADRTFKRDTTRRIENPLVPTVDQTIFERRLARDYELGGDITRPFLGERLKLVALVTQENQRDRSRIIDEEEGFGSLGGFRQNGRARLREAVGRIAFSGTSASGWAYETGAEGAYNQLVSELDLVRVLPSGAEEPIGLGLSNATVSEQRGEAYATAGKQLSKTLMLDLGLTYEQSRITVSGDQSRQSSLSFLKPKLTLNWTPSDKTRIQLLLERKVGQLNFFDFVSRANFSNDRVDGGNADLVPERSWDVSLAFERTVLGDGLVKFDATYRRITDLADRVPVADGLDAPGNLPRAKALLLSASFDVPLQDIGIKGGRLSMSASRNFSEVRDPYTLQPREFSGLNSGVYEMEFSQDLGAFSWSLNGSYHGRAYEYRNTDTLELFQDYPEINIEGVYRISNDLTLTGGVENIIDRTRRQRQTFYAPTRVNPEPSSVREYYIRPGLKPYITLQYVF